MSETDKQDSNLKPTTTTTSPEEQDATQTKYPPEAYMLRRTPLAKNPFHNRTSITNVDIIKASDLLLDVAATTTIASLTDGTTVLEASSAISYMTFLGLTWWIWASQVLYNVRYRQRDWLHHGFVILQLLTFCALAAFAGGFDISQGIVSDDGDRELIERFTSRAQSYITGNQGIEDARSDFLSRVNSTGISIVLAFSRVVLILQYLRVWSCASRANPTKQGNEFVRAAKWHILSLSLSLTSCVAAVVVVRTDDAGVTRGHSVAKVLLWILPIFLEIFTHCYIDWNIGPADDQVVVREDAVAKDPEEQRKKWILGQIKEMLARADSVFIILLGVGLDRITAGFQRIAGNVIVGAKGAGLIVSAGIIFVTQLTLYFNLHKRIEGRMQYRQALMWFFGNFFYVAALILVLQGTAALLELGNLVSAIDLPLDIIYDIGNTVRLAQGRLLDPDTEFPQLRAPLTKVGMSLDNTVYFINNGTRFFYTIPPNVTAPNIDTSDPVGASLAIVRISSVLCLRTILKNLDATPDSGSLLEARINDFTTSVITNSTDLNMRASRERYAAIISGVRGLHAEPSEWYFGVAGATLVMQFILWHILHPDWRDINKNGKFEAWIQGLRFSFGAITILLLTISANDTVPPNDFSGMIYEFNDTLIHTVAQRGWMLAIFAGIIVLEQILEQLVEVHTGRPEKENTDSSNPIATRPLLTSQYTSDDGVADKKRSYIEPGGAASDVNVLEKDASLSA